MSLLKQDIALLRLLKTATIRLAKLAQLWIAV
jgi:hypothetical protein